MTPPPEKTVFGHPKGLYYLAFTELWERFSYYGMTALVVLYMVNQLLLPGHVEHIAGFAALRAAVESMTGPLSAKALASQVFGMYSGLVYFTPLLGGLIADRWIGQRNAVVIGALLMSAGHLAMTFDQSFLIALALLVTGSGFLKGNITSQVGAVYPPGDEARSGRGYVIYSTAINVGGVLGPLTCGLLAQVYGWHTGFGAASALMLLALAIYLAGYRSLPAGAKPVTAAAKPQEPAQATAGKSDAPVIIALVAIIAISSFPSLTYFQHFNALPVWIQDHVAVNVGNFLIPIPWFQSIDALTSILAAAPLLWLWQGQAARGTAPGNLAKIGVGSWIGAAANFILVAAIAVTDGPINPVWPFLYCVGLGISFIHYWPALLALVSRSAPIHLTGTMMGIVFASLFVVSLLMGWLGAQYESTGPLLFWSVHAGIGAAGGILVMVFGKRLDGVLQSGASGVRENPSS